MSKYGPRIAALQRRAHRDRERLEPDAVDREAAMALLTEGVWDTIEVYIDARAGDEFVHLSPAEFRALEDALNTWLACWAACQGASVDPEVSIREAAEAFLDTHDVVDVARVLTGVEPAT